MFLQLIAASLVRANVISRQDKSKSPGLPASPLDSLKSVLHKKRQKELLKVYVYTSNHAIPDLNSFVLPYALRLKSEFTTVYTPSRGLSHITLTCHG